MQLDNIDIKILKENFDDEIINQLDQDNVVKIYKYLIANVIYFAKDLFISQADIFLLKYNEFVDKFETLKKEYGEKLVIMLEEDPSILDIMYE